MLQLPKSNPKWFELGGFCTLESKAVIRSYVLTIQTRLAATEFMAEKAQILAINRLCCMSLHIRSENKSQVTSKAIEIQARNPLRSISNRSKK